MTASETARKLREARREIKTLRDQNTEYRETITSLNAANAAMRVVNRPPNHGEMLANLVRTGLEDFKTEIRKATLINGH